MCLAVWGVHRADQCNWSEVPHTCIRLCFASRTVRVCSAFLLRFCVASYSNSSGWPSRLPCLRTHASTQPGPHNHPQQQAARYTPVADCRQSLAGENPARAGARARERRAAGAARTRPRGGELRGTGLLPPLPGSAAVSLCCCLFAASCCAGLGACTVIWPPCGIRAIAARAARRTISASPFGAAARSCAAQRSPSLSAAAWILDHAGEKTAPESPMC